MFDLKSSQTEQLINLFKNKVTCTRHIIVIGIKRSEQQVNKRLKEQDKNKKAIYKTASKKEYTEQELYYSYLTLPSHNVQHYPFQPNHQATALSFYLLHTSQKIHINTERALNQRNSFLKDYLRAIAKFQGIPLICTIFSLSDSKSITYPFSRYKLDPIHRDITKKYFWQPSKLQTDRLEVSWEGTLYNRTPKQE